MTRQVCILQGHPHPTGKHLCHAIAEVYAQGAREAKANISIVDIGALDVPTLKNPEDFVAAPPPQIVAAQEVVSRAQHLVIIFPLWLGTMPALVKSFFEQLSRDGFAIQTQSGNQWPRQMLKGKSARIIVTMGMPSFAYRWLFGAHGVRTLSKSIFGMSGIKPVHETLIGRVGALNASNSAKLLERIKQLGQRLQ
ncbi:MAG: flavodoxin family protein [Alphaproteobacteria bacterium]|jgi:putative NADPH-quinone reductase|nr:MAG: flavodoxin family protein [Alphaproteobacteria bacterium]